MSGTASVPNSFAAAVTATGAQLDADFGTIVAYINDPTNRNNYAADAGATNTVVLTFAPPVVGGYTAGLELAWKWAATNTGGVVVNANGLGNVALVNADGTALAPGQGVIGSIGKGIYDGTRIIYISGAVVPATQAQMETATASASYVSPTAMKYHPGVAKAVASFAGTVSGTVTPGYSFGIERIVRQGTGTYSIVMSLAFSSTEWAGLVSASSAQSQVNGLRSTTHCLVITNDSAGQPEDSGRINFSAYGDLP